MRLSISMIGILVIGGMGSCVLSIIGRMSIIITIIIITVGRTTALFWLCLMLDRNLALSLLRLSYTVHRAQCRTLIVCTGIVIVRSSCILQRIARSMQ